MKNLIMELFNVNEIDIDTLITDKKGNEIFVKIKLVNKDNFCVKCGSLMHGNGYRNKKINHKALAESNCHLTYISRRLRCRSCGHSRYEKNPFALNGFNYSTASLRQCMKDLRDPLLNYKQVADRYGLSITQLERYFDSFVVIPRIPLPYNLGIDEIHSNMAKSKNSAYLGVLIDNTKYALIDILPSRNKVTIRDYLIKIPKEERDKVKYVTMDLWEPYKDVTHHYLPNAICAADPFHVIEHLTDDFDSIRIKIMNKYPKGTRGYYLLKTWNKLLLSDDYNFDGKKVYNHILGANLNYGDIKELILNLDPKLSIAYELKEDYRYFNSNCTYEFAKEYLADLIEKFIKADIDEYREFINIMIKWNQEIVNSFIIDELTGNRLSNAKTEAMNKSIKKNISNANGLSNFKRFRNRMIYCFNAGTYYSLHSGLTSLKRKKRNKK